MWFVSRWIVLLWLIKPLIPIQISILFSQNISSCVYPDNHRTNILTYKRLRLGLLCLTPL
jgi:hypothetical protein